LTNSEPFIQFSPLEIPHGDKRLESHDEHLKAQMGLAVKKQKKKKKRMGQKDADREKHNA